MAEGASLGGDVWAQYANNPTIEIAQDGSHNKPFVCIVRAAAEIVIAEWPKTASPPSTKSREETDEGESQQSDGHSRHEYTLSIAPYVANRILGSTSARSSMHNPFRPSHSSLVAACEAHTLRIVLSIMVTTSLAFAVFSAHGDSKGPAQQMMLPRFCLSCIEMRFIARLRGLCIFLGTPKFSTISISNPRDRRAR